MLDFILFILSEKATNLLANKVLICKHLEIGSIRYLYEYFGEYQIKFEWKHSSTPLSTVLGKGVPGGDALA